MHSYCMKLFHCKNLLFLRKERLHIPTLFFYFIFSAPAFLVPATVSCARIPGVFIDNRMCLININTFFLFNLKYVADLTFILRPFQVKWSFPKLKQEKHGFYLWISFVDALTYCYCITIGLYLLSI
jgi:hypothetical protein